MSAAEVLKAARAAGIRVGIDGDDVCDAGTPPPAAVLDLLLRHTQSGWTADDWQTYFDKRAGIAESRGGLPRVKAEAQALACCIIEWLNRIPARSTPGCCLGCGGGSRRGDPVLPFGIETSSHAWLNSACWPAWHRTWQADAIAALVAMGIKK